MTLTGAAMVTTEPPEAAPSVSLRVSPPLWKSVGKPLLLIAGLVGAGLIMRGLSVERLRSPGGWMSYLLLAALFCAVGMPRQVVAFAGGYSFGAAEGFGLALSATALGCVVDFLWARLLARTWMRRFLARREQGGRLVRLSRLLAVHPFSATLTLRLLPVGSNVLLNILAGVLDIRPIPFVAASIVGFIPQTLVFVLLGGGTRIGHGVQLAVAIMLFCMSMMLGFWLYRRTRLGREAIQPNEAVSAEWPPAPDDESRPA
ncbi:TVP38/TMEM64 family protein [Granulibacter bethesdensis]|uniref:TVP38/TMEM64 family protein n=1 Tax=Granulibacter bethesdensis TaxID=364410 RepID=UPI000A5A0C47|nr:VTT domain-containing protein [Granulibacter bethesdensis]